MARFTGALASATISTVILSIFVVFSNLRSSSFISAIVIDPMTVTLLPQPAGSNLHTMFLPLFPPVHNSSFSVVDAKYRRHLQKSNDTLPISRMPLHDDLAITGYYTTRLWIGSPPQKFALIVDTGSSVTYVPCSFCKHCGNHQDPKFDPKLSSTYKSMRCNMDCTCDAVMHQCTYLREYAEMSSSSGVIGEDVISFGNQSELSPQRATFGCETSETGNLYTQRADGIMGLGRGELSLVDQLVDQGLISNSFSLCYGGMDVGGGAMVLGGISPPPGMVYVYSDPIRSPYYNVDLKELHVAGKRLPLNTSIFDEKYGTVLDSGTTYAYIPKTAYLAFRDAMIRELHSFKQISGSDSRYKDVCFSGVGSDISTLPRIFPSVEMVFENGIKLSLSPENYLFRHSSVHGAYCLGIFQNADEPTTILGGIVVRNTFVMYDREHDKIGFWKTNCSDLLARLTASGVLPSTPDKSPSSPPAPSGPPYNIFPGSKIERIIFYMSLDIKYSALEHHITELTRLIAKELHADSSQVYLLDYISGVNGSSVTMWMITPPKPAEHMSNEMASNIVAIIAEDKFHLPKIFGKHHISNWYIESTPNRSWWQDNMTIVLTLLLILVLGFVGSTIRWLWRYRRQTRFPYRPIGPILRELELQAM